MTAAQQRILDAVRADGERRYNGRAKRSIEELERRDLVIVDWGMRMQAKAHGTELVWVITVRPK